MRPPLGLLAVLLLCVGCSRSPAGPAGAWSERPPVRVTAPTARHIQNDAVYVLGPERTWTAPEPNQPPGMIRVGATTREDLLRVFGRPTYRRMTRAGDEVWYYASSLLPAGAERRGINTRTQLVATQRKVAVTFAKGSAVVTASRTYVTGERIAYPFLDTGPPFPELHSESVSSENTFDSPPQASSASAN